MKLASSSRSWKEPLKLESFYWDWKSQFEKNILNFARYFPTKTETFNCKLFNLKISNFSFFSIALSNYTYPIVT